MEAKLSTLIEHGKISLDTQRYNSDCDSLMREIGDVVIKDVVIPSEKGYLLTFFPIGYNNIINHMEKTDITFQGEKLIAPLFSINYDKNLKFESYKKRESRIPPNVHYMILLL